MKTVGIICEYNPFHNGHKLHIEKTKNALNAECVVCLMSGNVVQRGDVAIFDMNYRAKKAVENGADLVLEIPPRFVLTSAQFYAYYGVYILNALNGIDYLSFGSECGNVEELDNELKNIDENKIKENLKSGKTYGACISESEILKNPNNILGLEYLKALKNLNSDIIPFTLKREYVEHHSKESADNFASASFIRELIKQNKNYEKYVPYSEYEEKIYFGKNKDILLKYKLASSKEEDLGNLANISEGLNNRIVKFKNEENFEKIIDSVKCKRYVRTRIQRALCSILFDIKKENVMPTYTRVLAFNETGQKFLKEIKKKSQIKIYSKITKKDLYNDKLLQEELRINEIRKIIDWTFLVTSLPIMCYNMFEVYTWKTI